MRMSLMTLCLCLVSGLTYAAQVKFLVENKSLILDVQVVDPMQACNVSLSGVIEKGDLEKLAGQITALREKSDVRNSSRILVLCLDSQGGSFVEAVKIGKYLKQKIIGTKIEKGARCESACALIFMSGNFPAHEAGAYHWRVMHPEARLGFHAPSLTLGEGTYDSKTVQKAYNLALQTISDTIFDVMTTTDFEGGLSLEVSLLGEMLKTPSSQMSYVDTIDKVGRWKITLVPVLPERAVSDLLFAQGCINAFSWERDETAIVSFYGNLKNIPIVHSNSDEGGIKVSVTLYEMAGEGCEFFAERGSRYLSQFRRVDITFKGVHGIAPEHYLDPATRLASLSGQASPRQKNEQADLPDFSGATGECTVIGGNTIIDRDPCLRVDEVKQGRNNTRILVSSFIWPSGAKTVLVYKANRLSINGQPTRNVTNTIAGRGAICSPNPASGNIFCYRAR